MRERRRPWGRIIAGAAVLALVVLVCLAVVQLRAGWRRAEVQQACAAVEAASRARIELASNIVQAAEFTGSLDSGLRGDLQAWAARASATLAGPCVSHDPAHYEAFRTTQLELGELLAGVWPRWAATPAGQAVAQDLRADVEATTVLLAERISQLEALIGDPGRGVAAIAAVGP
jgi:hypothetical protein